MNIKLGIENRNNYSLAQLYRKISKDAHRPCRKQKKIQICLQIPQKNL